MVKLILRWTIGENNVFKLNSQAFEMLNYSIRFSKLIFNKFNNYTEYLVCYNNLDISSNSKVLKICNQNDVKSIDVTDKLPIQLRVNNVKNSWWKYAIPRFDIKSYEIIIDNDVIFWELPATLEQAIKNKSLVALQDGVGKFYGDFLGDVNSINYNLKLNAGLLGCPPGFEINFDYIDIDRIQDFFFSEQGFTALNFAKYNGSKLLIPLSEIQQLNANRICALDLLENYYGGHFCGCSYDIEQFWSRNYISFIEKKYRELVLTKWSEL